MEQGEYWEFNFSEVLIQKGRCVERFKVNGKDRRA